MGILNELHKQIKNKELSCSELLLLTLKKIEESNSLTNAVVELFSESAMKRAKSLDEAIAKGADVTLGMGIPVGIKDNMCLEGEGVTCASKFLEGYKSPYTSTAVQKVIDQGFVPVGRTNMDEFAMGSSNEYSVYGAVSNPWNLDLVSGGSSGGSAAAVASGVLPLTLGSDTGGSIRQPASFCGVVGLKPTYGRVSRYGLVAFASSLDQIGPFAQNIEDLAVLLDAICGFDPNDSTSEQMDGPNVSGQLTLDSLKGKRIGIPNQLMSDNMDVSVRDAVNASLKIMEQSGASIDYFDFPFVDEALSTYYILAPAEVSTNLSRFDGVRYGQRNMDAQSLNEMILTSRQQGFGDEVKRRIILGTYVLSSGYYDAYYGKAQQVRALISEKFSSLFEQYDVICSPTSPTTAFEKNKNTKDPLQMYLSDIATIPANLAGLPAVSLPCGLDQQGLPIGLQMIGSWFKERDLLQVAHVFEAQCQFKQKHLFSEVVLP